MSTALAGEVTRLGRLDKWNGAKHYRALVVYLAVVVAHWLEHAAQAVQVYVFDVPRAKAGGLLGLLLPSVVSSEMLHWAYAAYMLGGFMALRRAMVGESRFWWDLAYAIQAWHFLEHTLLLSQAVTGWRLAGRHDPTSLLQLIVPRVETHLIYNILVLIPLLTALGLHWFRADGRTTIAAPCTCAARFPAQ